MFERPSRRTVLKVAAASPVAIGAACSAMRSLAAWDGGVATFPVTRDSFGMTRLGLEEPVPTALLEGPTRLWDCWLRDPSDPSAYVGISWAQLNPAPGRYAWERLDRALDLAASASRPRDLLYTFGHVPAWAHPVGSEAFMQAWTEFVGEIAPRGAGRIGAWGVWNEPNDSGPGHVPNAVLARMAAIAYPRLKSADPRCLVLSPEYVGNGAHEFLAFCRAGGRDAFDVLGCHLYGTPDPEASPRAGGLPAIVGSYRDALRIVSLEQRPIWNTEFAEHGLSRIPGPPLEAGRDFVAQALPLLASLGVARSFFYAWDGQPRPQMPVGRMKAGPDGSSSLDLNAVGLAWQAMTGWLIGATLAPPRIRGRQVAISLEREDGVRKALMWSFGKPSTFEMAGTQAIHLHRLDGSTEALPPGRRTVTLGDTPVLVTRV